MNKEQIREEIKRKRRERNKIRKKMMYTRRALKHSGMIYNLGNYNWIDIEEDKKRLTNEMKDLKKELDDLRR